MKVISLLQPWATLVVMGAKKIETRSRHTKYRGEILIHASQNKKEAERLCGIPGDEKFKRFIRHYTDLPFGAIIGKVNLVGVSATENIDPIYLLNINYWGKGNQIGNWWIEKEFGDYSPGRYGYYLKDNVQFKTHFPCAGQVTIPWTCPKVIEEQILNINHAKQN